MSYAISPLLSPPEKFLTLGAYDDMVAVDLGATFNTASVSVFNAAIGGGDKRTFSYSFWCSM